MDMNLLVDIIDFLEGIDDSINDFADRIEIEPIRLASDTYLTGFKRLPFAYNVLEAHVIEINIIKIIGRRNRYSCFWICFHMSNSSTFSNR